MKAPSGLQSSMHGGFSDLVKEGDTTLHVVRKYGTHSIHDLLTDGIDADLTLRIYSWSSKSRGSDVFDGQPGCLNGIDLEGSFVESVSLVAHDIQIKGDGGCIFTPTIVISGRLGILPTACPECDCSSAQKQHFFYRHSMERAVMVALTCLALLSDFA